MKYLGLTLSVLFSLSSCLSTEKEEGEILSLFSFADIKNCMNSIATTFNN